VIKLGGCVLFVAKKNGGRRRNGGREEEGCSPSYKLNIIDKINLSVILFIKVTRHCTFLLFFLILSFSIVIPPVNTNRRFMSVFTDEYNDGIICRYSSP
jgi:hypothetical protein